MLMMDSPRLSGSATRCARLRRACDRLSVVWVGDPLRPATPRLRSPLAGQDLLGRLLLGLVVARVADQPVAHTVQHVDDVAKGGVHLAHGVVGGGLGGPTPAGTGDVLRGRPHLAGLVLDGLSVYIETARHVPHRVRVGHKARGHVNLYLSRNQLLTMAIRQPTSSAPSGGGPRTGCPQ